MSMRSVVETLKSPRELGGSVFTILGLTVVGAAAGVASSVEGPLAGFFSFSFRHLLCATRSPGAHRAQPS